MHKIFYTLTDEAPLLSTRSFLPIIRIIFKHFNIDIETKNISLSYRILSNFKNYLYNDQNNYDDLNIISNLVKSPHTNIIKLPNISASIPQLISAIKELQLKGYNIPNYPFKIKDNQDNNIKLCYDKVLGSVVNLVLRDGNSDRRVVSVVKKYAEQHPHFMGEWRKDSKSHVVSMSSDDFYDNEKSCTFYKNINAKIVHTDYKGNKTILKDNILIEEKDIFDVTKISIRSLREFYKREIINAKKENTLISFHFKTTMMKISDLALFGHAVEIFFEDIFKKYSNNFKLLNINSRNGWGDVIRKIKKLPKNIQDKINIDIEQLFLKQPNLAMVDVNKGITNLNNPNDVIIDASMPAAIRLSGKMWNKFGKLQDIKAIIPDKSYSGLYSAVMDFCKENGSFDVQSIGDISNVGLMAKGAEEYGSNDKTFEIKYDGKVEVIDNNGCILFEHNVEKGDIWRACQTKDIAIKNWVKLAIDRAILTNNPLVFWLDLKRPHDKNLIYKVNKYLTLYNINNLSIKILPPVEATKYSLKIISQGKNIISATGNVLRDYLTDLFPILELGTSSKILSIVSLLSGGTVFETGAGGSAPKHFKQFIDENHLRWDSLGEFLALQASLNSLFIRTKDNKIKLLEETLSKAIEDFLNNDKFPRPNVGELDTRGSHFYLTLYWIKAMAEQNNYIFIKNKFMPIYLELKKNENKIIQEIDNIQGTKVNIGGYYFPDKIKLNIAMRPSKTFNLILSKI